MKDSNSLGTIRSHLSLYWEMARPFTLVAPALGMLSGSIAGWGAEPRLEFTRTLLLNIVLGTIMAAVLNAASNTINQIFDLQVDRVNKPHRPIPSGRISVREAGAVSAFLYGAALLLAWLVNLECFILASLAALFTIIYSAPPLRTKAHGIWANVTIAIPRGVMLKVAGWSCARTVLDPEPWYIGLIFGLFLLGASSTKDFSDMEGDARGGCRTRSGRNSRLVVIAPPFQSPSVGGQKEAVESRRPHRR